MSRGVYSESSLRGEIEYALQYGRPTSGRTHWTIAELAVETQTTPKEVKAVVLDLRDEGFVIVQGGGVVVWN